MATVLAEDVATLDLLLVDDHALVRQGLRAVLEREPDLRVVAESASPGEALAAVDRHRPDIVLLDLKAADAGTLALCEELARREVAVVVLTACLEDEPVLRAVRAGARGYVVKDVDAAVLVRAIHTVARGESAFDVRSAAAMLRCGGSAPEPAGPHQLTGREVEVLDLLAHGLSNKDIGGRLYISETTAKFHVGNILRKLAVTSRAEAVYAAGKLGLL